MSCPMANGKWQMAIATLQYYNGRGQWVLGCGVELYVRAAINSPESPYPSFKDSTTTIMQ